MDSKSISLISQKMKVPPNENIPLTCTETKEAEFHY